MLRATFCCRFCRCLRHSPFRFNLFPFRFGLLLYLELFLAYATKGAYIIIGEILECYAWFNTLLGVTNLRVINPLTYCTDILFHNGFILS